MHNKQQREPHSAVNGAI